MSEIKNFLFTRKEAANFIVRAPVGARFAVSIRVDLPVGENGETHFRDAGATYVNVSRSQAKRIVLDITSAILEEKGARIPMHTNSYDLLDKKRITYWIG